MKRLYLNIKNCGEKTKKTYGDITKLPIKKGNYECEYDVIESELPKEFVEKIRGIAKKRISNVSREADYKPIGFDVKNMPAGAFIEAKYDKT